MAGHESPSSQRSPLQPVMPHSCQACSKRKVRCDKTPYPQKCSSCLKSGIACIYPQTPLPRRSKTSAVATSAAKKIAEYERILNQHGLLPSSNASSSAPEERENVLPSPQSQRAESTASTPSEDVSHPSTLLTGRGKTRYIELNHWHVLGNDIMPHMSDDDDDEATTLHERRGGPKTISSDILSASAFSGSLIDLSHHHPSHEEALWLWKIHVDRVEPICKILHIPSTFELLSSISREPGAATRSQECLLFTIYHFAVFSLTDNEYNKRFRLETRAAVLQRMRYACEQSLVNVRWLQTTDLMVLQAIVLFFLPCRYHYDPHTYWILTGVAMRIAQRIGVHRDGEKLGLPPFEVQMRRRLYNQLIPLDGIASSMAGTRIGGIPNDWDSQPPLNLNDDQIWPGMAELPQETEGATEMIFCLTRATLGLASLKIAKLVATGASQDTIDAVIQQTEHDVQDKYLRFCDVIYPLHFLTMCLGRSAITAMRLRPRLARVRNRLATPTERQEIFVLAQSILSTDIAANANMGLPKYMWHARSFFAWGLWDSLTFTLLSIGSRQETLSRNDVDRAWERIQQLYEGGDISQQQQVLHKAVGRLILRAWQANPANNLFGEPDFITALKSFRNGHGSQARSVGIAESLPSSIPTDTTWLDLPGATDIMDFLTEDFPFDSTDPDLRVQWLS